MYGFLFFILALMPSFAEAANKAREILANENIAKTKADAEVQTAAQNAKASKEPSLTPQQFMDWMNATKNSPMSPQDKKDVIQDVKEAAKASVNPKPSNSSGQGVATKDKIFIFQAIDFKGSTITDFPLLATVYDILHSKTVLAKAGFTGFGQTLLKFDDSQPTIKIVIDTNPITIKS